jgi:hypothetical protein
LIWVYADLALDEEYLVTGVTISITKPSGARLWVSFEGETSQMRVEELVLSGPTSKITQFSQALNKGDISLDFHLLPDKQGIKGPGNWQFSIASVIGESDQMRQWGLMVERAEPDVVTVTATELIPRSLTIKCEDENNSPLIAQKITPAQVEMWVPQGWVGDALVKLTSEEVRQARSFAVSKIPTIRVGGETWQVQKSVEVTMPQDALRESSIQNVKLGIKFSLLMQGKYEVVIEEPDLAKIIGSPISVQATPEARQAYENQRYQVILELDDSLQNAEPGTVHEQELIYNFPQEYVRKGEIMLSPAQTPLIAKFKLVPISSRLTP